MTIGKASLGQKEPCLFYLPQRLKKPLHILCVIIKMRRYAHTATPETDIYVTFD